MRKRLPHRPFQSASYYCEKYEKEQELLKNKNINNNELIINLTKKIQENNQLLILLTNKINETNELLKKDIKND